jgi:2-dehydro-3-deoxy-D-gluconate 5-dehydrogenase
MSGRVSDLFRLDGKTAVVTGCSRGLGASMARALAEAGADIVGVSKSGNDEGLRSAVETLGRAYRREVCDLSSREAVLSLCGRLSAQRIDVLVNNAGVIRRAPAAEHSDAFWDEVIDTNLSAPFLLAREIGRGMLERGSGKIVFIASLLSFQGGITVPGYAASKGGVAQLTKALANEWAARGVHVNAIAPGYMATDNTAALQQDPVRAPAILSRIPAGRWGSPDDLNGAVVFLASAASDYVHGTVLTVDGGWMAR